MATAISINEVFYSIQGEGPNSGAPAVFIRFQGCPLRCPWCDTPTALKKNAAATSYTTRELLNHISHFPCKHALITGGDPAMQPEALRELAQALIDNGYTLELETSGYQLVDAETCAHFSFLNIGLKLPEESNSFKDSYYQQVIDHYGPMPHAAFKIVVSRKADIDYVERLIADFGYPRERIWLMPLGADSQELQANTPFVIQACLAGGFHFSPRLHIMAGIK